VPELCQYGEMARVKTTLVIDESLIRQIRVRAARSARRDSEVLDEVLREGLGSVDRLRSTAALDEEEALTVASEVVHELRREGRVNARRRSKS
jgi:hypothetical protein